MSGAATETVSDILHYDRINNTIIEPVTLGGTTTKGDLIVHDGSSSTVLPIGGDGDLLVVDPAEAIGMKWTRDPTVGDTTNTSTTFTVESGDVTVLNVGTTNTTTSSSLTINSDTTTNIDIGTVITNTSNLKVDAITTNIDFGTSITDTTNVIIDATNVNVTLGDTTNTSNNTTKVLGDTLDIDYGDSNTTSMNVMNKGGSVTANYGDPTDGTNPTTSTTLNVDASTTVELKLSPGSTASTATTTASVGQVTPGVLGGAAPTGIAGAAGLVVFGDTTNIHGRSSRGNGVKYLLESDIDDNDTTDNPSITLYQRGSKACGRCRLDTGANSNWAFELGTGAIGGAAAGLGGFIFRTGATYTTTANYDGEPPVISSGTVGLRIYGNNGGNDDYKVVCGSDANGGCGFYNGGTARGVNDYLDHYARITTNVAASSGNPHPISATPQPPNAVAFRFTRIGNVVHLRVPARDGLEFSNATGSNSNNIVYPAAVPADFRPVIQTSFPIRIYEGGGAVIQAELIIQTNGDIEVNPSDWITLIGTWNLGAGGNIIGLYGGNDRHMVQWTID